MILGINNEDDAKRMFPEDSFIRGCWVNFKSEEEEGFLIKNIFILLDGRDFYKSSMLRLWPLCSILGGLLDKNELVSEALLKQRK